MRVQTATGVILFTLLQLYAVILAIALPATVPSQLLHSLLTPNLTIPYNVTYSATSPSNYLPPDPSYETTTTTRFKFYNYGVLISRQDTVECLEQLRHIYMLHDPRSLVGIPHIITVGSVELLISPGARLTWGQVLMTDSMLGRWLDTYEYRTLKFTQWFEWHDYLVLVATGNLTRVGSG